MGSLKKKAVTGVLWASIETMGVRLITLASFLVMARILTKEDFGLLAMAAVYVSFLELVVRVGITEVLVQRDELSELHKDTAYWATAVLGMVAILFSIVVAPVAAAWSGESDLEAIIYWLSIGLIPVSLSRVQEGLLLRDLQFRSLAIRKFICTTSGAAVGITMALKGYGVWSLVVQQLVERFIELATLLWVTRWYPSLRFSWSAFSELWTYSSRILFINILNFAGSNIDRLLIGQFFGITALGIYVVGRRIVDVIIDVVRVVIGRVALSFFSRLQLDVERLFEGSFVVDRLVTLFGLPVMGLFLVYGGEITTAVFGEKWRDAGIICQIVAMGGIIRICVLFAPPLLKSTGHPGSLVTANLAMISTSILLSSALASFGLNAFIVGWVSGYIAFACLMFYSLHKILHYPIARVLRQYIGPFLALTCTWIFMMAIDPITAEYLKNPLGLMLLRSILFIFFYGIFVLLLNFKAVKQTYLDVGVLFHPKKKA